MRPDQHDAKYFSTQIIYFAILPNSESSRLSKNNFDPTRWKKIQKKDVLIKNYVTASRKKKKTELEKK